MHFSRFVWSWSKPTKEPQKQNTTQGRGPRKKREWKKCVQEQKRKVSDKGQPPRSKGSQMIVTIGWGHWSWMTSSCQIEACCSPRCVGKCIFGGMRLPSHLTSGPQALWRLTCLWGQLLETIRVYLQSFKTIGLELNEWTREIPLRRILEHVFLAASGRHQKRARWQALSLSGPKLCFLEKSILLLDLGCGPNKVQDLPEAQSLGYVWVFVTSLFCDVLSYGPKTFVLAETVGILFGHSVARLPPKCFLSGGKREHKQDDPADPLQNGYSYIYIYMYVYVYTYTVTHYIIRFYIFSYTIFIIVYEYMYYIMIHIYIYVHIYIYIYIYTYLSIYTYIYIHICIYIYTYTCIHIDTSI